MDKVEAARFDDMLFQLRQTGLRLTHSDVTVRKVWFEKGIECRNKAQCYVSVTKESCDEGPKFWVVIERNGERLTPQWYFIRGRAEYDVAEWEHLLNDGQKPNILSYQTDHNCDRCKDTKLVSIKTWPGGIEVDNDDQPCPECT